MWLRLDDTLTDHPKFFGIDPRAGWLWILGLCYAGRHVLNGRLPRGTAFSLAAQVDRQQTVLDDDEPEMVRQLVSRGLWERAKDAYVIHDFLDYNPSRKEVLSERRAARLRSRKARQIRVSANVRSSEVRANVSRTSDPTPGTPGTPGPSRPQEQTNRRQANRSALQMAQDSATTALGDASARLVQAASERFTWKLTKTRLADEWRLAGELLEYWDEATILRAIVQRRKLSSMRWLAEFIPTMPLIVGPTVRYRPAVLEMPEPTPEEQTRAAAARERAGEMIRQTMRTLPKMPA